MKEIIESVNEFVRPKDGFACSDCPFSSWRSGLVNEDDFLDCYCHKNHLFTYDSLNRIDQNVRGNIDGRVAYKHIKICLDKENAVNEVLGGGLR